MRRFEFVQGSSAKFWMGDVEGTSFVVIFGRLGTAGQRKDKAFSSEDAAKRELDKKIAEKLREGYHEVSAEASAQAPAGAKGAAAATSKLDLTPRVRGGTARPEAIKAAAGALRDLNAAVGRRSWDLGRRTRKARRTLGAASGIDPASIDSIAPVWSALMGRVIADKPSDRLPLVRAMELLYEVDARAFERALTSSWKDAPESSPAQKALLVLAKQLEELRDPELALRVGSILVDRPDHGSMSAEAGWKRRWKALAPHLEAHLITKGLTLKGYLKAIDTAGDAYVARRVSRMLAA